MPTTAILTAEGVGKSYAARGLFAALCGAPVKPDLEPGQAVSPGALTTGARPDLTRAQADQTSALESVDLTVERGGSLGIIGRNGAGKSTLLRLIAGVSKPTRGRLVVRGRVRSLLDLGAGFLEEMSGRDNALTLLALDDVTPEKRASLAQAALSFAALGRFADEPVRTYSAGMRLRLAYAVAIALEPEILVADEVLAVGDEEFQRRCSQHVQRFVAGGGTLVLASHSLYLVEKLCREAIWLEGGRVAAHGPSRSVTAAYRAFVEEREASRRDGDPGVGTADAVPEGFPAASSLAKGRALREGAEPAPLRLASALLGAPAVQRITEGEPLDVDLDLPPDRMSARLWVEIRRPSGVCVATAPVTGRRLRIASCPLLPGHYRLRLVDAQGRLAGSGAELKLDCVGSSRELGSVRLEHRWT